MDSRIDASLVARSVYGDGNSTVDPAVALSIAHSSAALFVSLWISWVCYGTILILVPNYLFAFRMNQFRERAFIVFLFIINTFDIAIDVSKTIKIYVSHFGDAVYMVSFHTRIEDHILFFSSIYIIFFCQCYLIVKCHLYLRSTQRALHAWRLVILGVNVALLVGGTAAGFTGQWRMHEYDNYLLLSQATFRNYGQLYSIMRIVFFFCNLLISAVCCWILSLELCDTKKWQLRHEDDIERRLKSLSMKAFVLARNSSPALILQAIVIIMYFVEGKSWTSGAVNALPRIYTISVILWTMVARPRTSSASSDSNQGSSIPDLSWSSSQHINSTALNEGDHRSSISRLNPSQLFTKVGRKEWRASLIEAKSRRAKRGKREVKTYTVDLGAEEENAGRSRRQSFAFGGDIPEEQGGKEIYGEKGVEWKEGTLVPQSQSLFTPVTDSEHLPTLLRHRNSLPSSGLRSATPEHELPSTYSAPLSPDSPTTSLSPEDGKAP